MEPDTSPTRSRRRVAVAVSGGGRSLANLLEQQKTIGSYEIAAVIASRPDCKAVEIAQRAGLPVFIERFTTDRLQDVASSLYDWLGRLGIHWIALAGFIRLFPLHPDWRGRIVNIHPALLPRFGGPGMYGDRVHRAVLAAGALESGATVHFVDERYDEGDIIAQIVVAVRPQDNESSLAARVFAAECRLYPRVLGELIEGRLPLERGRILRMTHDDDHP